MSHLNETDPTPATVHALADELEAHAEYLRAIADGPYHLRTVVEVAALGIGGFGAEHGLPLGRWAKNGQDNAVRNGRANIRQTDKEDDL